MLVNRLVEKVSGSIHSPGYTHRGVIPRSIAPSNLIIRFAQAPLENLKSPRL